MHKHALLFALLCAVSPSPAQSPAPAPGQPAAAASSTAAITHKLPPPSSALAAAFDAAAHGHLDPITRATFTSQPLAGWLDYAALGEQLDTLPITEGNAFLARYHGQPVATAFRTRWLDALAQRNAWPEFLDNWETSIHSTRLRCLHLQALMAMNRIDPQWTAAAQTLWRSRGSSLPSQCDPVFALLAARGELDASLRWQRLDMAIAAGLPDMVRHIGAGLSSADAKQAQVYADYLEAPSAAVSGWPVNDRSRQVAAVALAKLAKRDPDRAEQLLPDITATLGLGEAERGRVLYQIALWSVASYLPESARRLANVPAAAWDERLHEWQVREALARSDWAAARAAIARMPGTQRDDSRWLYFAARTSALVGDAAAAKALYAQAAQRPDFHGFLAADHLHKRYALCPWQLQASPAEQQAVLADPAFIRAVQLHALGRTGWAEREWKDALSRFTPNQRRVAVAIAQDNGWFDRGVFGLRQVNGERFPQEQRLYALRFPLHHADTIRREAARNRLDPAWIAAEIRAESVFNPKARSAANARGLMQVLPSTAASVAKRLGMVWDGADSLYDPDTNIALGSAYLRQLLDRYEDKPYLVIAGYNAGPSPLERWMSQRLGMAPDVWIETISYKETRDYVMRVLAFSTLYDWRLDGTARRLSDRLHGRQQGERVGFACPAAQAK